MQNSQLLNLNIFHQLFVNDEYPDSVTLMKHVVSGERDTAIFEQNKIKIHAERCKQDESW